MAVTFYDMATDPPYPFFLGHTVLDKQNKIVRILIQ